MRVETRLRVVGYARAQPWRAAGATYGAAAYVSLAALILRAYLFGIDSSTATWAPT